MRFTLDESQCRNLDVSAQREWILTNGIGGYAMGTAAGILTRRYHGHLIAATTPPTGRMLLLATLDATIQDNGPSVGISTNQYPGAIHPEGYLYLRRFEAAHAFVRWTYRAGTGEIAKELRVHPGTNAVTVRYRNVGKTSLALTVRPLVCHRDYHGEFHEGPGYPQALLFPADGEVVEQDGLGLYLLHPGAARTPRPGLVLPDRAPTGDRAGDSRRATTCSAPSSSPGSFVRARTPCSSRPTTSASSPWPPRRTRRRRGGSVRCSGRGPSDSSSRPRSGARSWPAGRGSPTGDGTP